MNALREDEKLQPLASRVICQKPSFGQIYSEIDGELHAFLKVRHPAGRAKLPLDFGSFVREFLAVAVVQVRVDFFLYKTLLQAGYLFLDVGVPVA
ncbi:hypothetical protein [Mucilaginibacter mali]|uniref:hypothetical protein n=1 Tax=Mucilaginibacter mali TaxID=2740462 RepID=UPI00191F5F97|nr:hypothetical protein [Mucilaginibacter mali]